MKFPTLLIIFICSKIIFAQVPSWYLSPEEYFPSTKYLMATGEGESEDIAYKDALSKLSSRFSVEVKSNKILRENYEESKDRQDYNSNIERNIKTETSNSFENIQILKREIMSGKFYLLIGLDIFSASTQLEDSIKSNESQIFAYQSDLEISKYKLERLRIYKNISELIQKNKNNYKLLLVLSGNSALMSINSELYNQLMSDYGKEKNKTSFKIEFLDNYNSAIYSNILAQFIKQGFTYDAHKPHFTIMIRISYDEQDIGRSDITTMAWFFDIDIYDQNNQIFQSENMAGRKSGLNKKTTIKKIETELSNKKLINLL
ncbi:MAG: LPP20 family lipoprotein [Candidatus Cloacimonetes bacterium]|nr:LPP20 family lipoprotein [Candidatus Cloacimonadota bacterium]MCF8262291.1 LPP20 family lipoprotein [Melioribacteraceae bacterium]